MVVLQKACVNCVRILEEDKHSHLRMLIVLRQRLKETDIVIDKPKHEKPITMRTLKNIAGAAKSVREAPSTSIHRLPQQLNISEKSLRRILHKDLSMTP